MKKQSPIKRLWELAASQHAGLKLSVSLAVLGVLGGIVPYVAAGQVLTNLFNGVTDFSAYMKACVVGLLGYAVKSVLYSLSLSVSHKATFELLQELREKMLHKLPKLSLGKVTATPSGEWKQLIVDQVESLERPVAHLIPEMTANMVGPLCILIYLIVLDWRMALLSLVSIPIGMFFMSIIMKSYGKQYAGSVQVGAQMNAAIAEYAEGIEVIKAFNQGESSYHKFSEKILANAQYYYDWMKSVQFLMSLSKSILPTTLLAVLPAGYLFYQSGSLDGGTFLTTVILSFSLSGLLMAAMNFVDSLARVGTVVGQIDALLAAEEQQHEKHPISFNKHDIVLDHVSFSYESGEDAKEIIHDVSLSIKDGSFNAFVGPSGGGKSTLAKLIAGYWDVEKGSIAIGGINAKKVPLEQLYNSVSFVSQNNFLFNESIRNNIRMGCLSATNEDVEHIAKLSGCHDFIENLENGYDTIAGEGGTHLSGGERQRISIARAMLKDAPIVIFDEATAYIDPENEVLMQQALGQLVAGKTVIAIAHRLSTITGADQIFVIEEGKIENHGTHQELLEKSKLYQSMWLAHVGAKGGK